jgi:serine/threonine-protein kinase
MQHPKSVGGYTIEGTVAGGGMAVVYRARPPPELAEAIGCPRVALKMLLPELARQPAFRLMFEEEAEICAQIHHENVVELIDFGSTRDGALFLVMEWVDGIDLAAALRSLRHRSLRMAPPIACAIVARTLRGLHAVHARTERDGTPRSIVHRDVSPSNILLSVDGAVKVADFGLARPLYRARRTLPGIVKGKFAYLAPEQTLDKPVDPRTDVFAAGIVLWEALASRSLFRRPRDLETVLAVRAATVPDVRAYAPGLDVLVARALRRALAADPDARFPSALAFAEALEASLAKFPSAIGDRQVAEIVVDVRRADARDAADAAAGREVDTARPRSRATEPIPLVRRRPARVGGARLLSPLRWFARAAR